jgi:hypothetical protein
MMVFVPVGVGCAVVNDFATIAAGSGHFRGPRVPPLRRLFHILAADRGIRGLRKSRD